VHWSLGLVLLHRRDYRRLTYVFATGIAVGALYMLPLHLYLHDGLATVHSYEGSRPLFGIPFYAILQGTFSSRPPVTNLILSYSWIIIIIGGIVLFAVSRCAREYRYAYPVEWVFAVLYTIAICCYNYPYWALGNFARFAIPSIPFAFIGWRQFLRERKLLRFDGLIPKLDPVVWATAVVGPALAACSAYGLRNLLR
jgi:hypothetical protein